MSNSDTEEQIKEVYNFAVYQYHIQNNRLGLNRDSKKEVLGMWLSNSFWMGVQTDLK